MKKILYIGNRLKHDKVTITTVDTLGMFLKKEGFEVRTSSGIRNKFFRLLDMCWAVFKYRKETDIVLIDTYSTQNFYYALLVAKACKLLKLPYIPILHGGNLPERLKKDKRKCRVIFKNAKINVAPSLYLYEQFYKYGFINTTHISNIIEINNYQFSPRRAKPKLLWVRSFSEIYNPLLALKVLKELLKTHPDSKLVMVGPDKDGSLNKCKAYAQKNKLPVTFTGKLKKNEWIKASKNLSIFINTTTIDNTPVSVIEAMALGLPVISTNVGGISYLLTDREDALLVDNDSVNQFVIAIKELLDSPKLVDKLVFQAREKAESFDWEKVKYQWFDILK